MGTTPWQEERDKLQVPATNINWHDAEAFCRALTEREIVANRLPKGSRYALPTEAQWEYACRAGSTTSFHFSDDESLLSSHGWWEGNSKGHPLPREVAQKKPNDWGLHDMHGNTWEWVSDWYSDTLDGGDDPLGPNNGTLKVLRGGCFLDKAAVLRSAWRQDASPTEERNNRIGFRVLLEAE
jgi:formylglycine-generating enzyme required for sulfatase activity